MGPAHCYAWLHYKSDLGLVHMESQVPSPIHVSKSRHGGKVPTFELQEIIKIWLIIVKFGSQLF